MITKRLMIVGGDRINTINQKLSNNGFEQVAHINGRKTNMVKLNIPEKADAILVITDYVNHNLANEVKKRANKKCIPVFYSRRSWSSIHQVLNQMKDT